MFWGALAITLAAASVASVMQRPAAVAQIRLAVETPDQPHGSAGDAAERTALTAMQQALGSATLRLAVLDAVGWRMVVPDLQVSRDEPEALRRLAAMLTVAPGEGGGVLLVRMRHDNPEVAADVDRAVVAVLQARQAPAARPAPVPVVTSLTGPRDVLVGLRARAAADLAAADRRAAVLSDGLTDTAHDMVSALRATAAPASGADVLDQGRVLMAELQLKRLQLASKYQDDFPAVTALDGEIDRLRAFLAGEQKRGAAVPHSPASPVLDTLGAERRRLAGELDEENASRIVLRDQLATLDRQLAAAVPPPPAPPVARAALPVLVAGSAILLSVPDPRLLSVPAILLVGLLGAVLLQWAMLRARTVIATVAEAELVLGLPVLRCLDVDGHPIPHRSRSRIAHNQ